MTSIAFPQQNPNPNVALLDQYVARLQNVQPFNIFSIAGDGSIAPWYEVKGDIVRDLIINESNLYAQVATVSAQVMHWGRLVAQARRIWEIEERNYRQWRARFTLDALNPKDKPESWKKPSQDHIEAMYQSTPEYAEHYKKIERAEEAFNAAQAIVDAFKAQRDMLRAAIVKHNDEGKPRLSV